MNERGRREKEKKEEGERRTEEMKGEEMGLTSWHQHLLNTRGREILHFIYWSFVCISHNSFSVSVDQQIIHKILNEVKS